MQKYKQFLKEHKNEVVIGVGLGTAFCFVAVDAMKWRSYFVQIAVALKELDMLDTVVEHLDNV